MFSARNFCRLDTPTASERERRRNQIIRAANENPLIGDAVVSALLDAARQDGADVEKILRESREV